MIDKIATCNTKCKKYSRGKYKIYLSFTTAFGLVHPLVYFIGVNPGGWTGPPYLRIIPPKHYFKRCIENNIKDIYFKQLFK